MTTTAMMIRSLAAAMAGMLAAAPALAEDTSAAFIGDKANCEGVTLTKVGYSPLTMEFDYFQFIEAGMKQIADQCKVEVVTADPRVDAAKQVSDIESMVSGGVGAVAIYSVDPTAVLTAVDAAKDAGVKVVAAVSVFEGADVSVGISDHDFGYAQGVLAGPVLKERKPDTETYKVAILNADLLGPNLDRKQGLIDGLKTGVTTSRWSPTSRRGPRTPRLPPSRPSSRRTRTSTWCSPSTTPARSAPRAPSNPPARTSRPAPSYGAPASTSGCSRAC
jgi:ABC-type sugar transport system substrate-binding protein